MNLILSLIDKDKSGERRHAHEVMQSLGIAYKRAVPQTLFDCWQFFDCINVPNKLPRYIRSFGLSDMGCIRAAHEMRKQK